MRIDLLIDRWDIEFDLQVIARRYKLIYYLIAGINEIWFVLCRFKGIWLKDFKPLL
jgi:hypothetical protein